MFVLTAQRGVTFKSSAIRMVDLVVTALWEKTRTIFPTSSVLQIVCKNNESTRCKLSTKKRADIRVESRAHWVVAFYGGDNCNWINIASLAVLQGVFVPLRR